MLEHSRFHGSLPLFTILSSVSVYRVQTDAECTGSLSVVLIKPVNLINPKVPRTFAFGFGSFRERKFLRAKYCLTVPWHVTECCRQLISAYS